MTSKSRRQSATSKPANREAKGSPATGASQSAEAGDTVAVTAVSPRATTSIDLWGAQRSLHNALTRSGVRTYTRPVLRLVVLLLVSIATLVPAVHIIAIVSSTGANTPSGDYIYTVPILDRMLDPTYHWQDFWQDTFIRSHCLALLFLIRIAVIEFTRLNIYVELYIGILAAFLKLLLLGDAFTATIGRRLSWLLWPALGALVFSTSQINVFTYGDASLQLLLNQLGLALGVWSLTRLPRGPLALTLMALGGIIACFSGGGGVPTWPAFLVGMTLLGYRRLWQYAVWFTAALVSLIPYIDFEIIHKLPGTDTSVTFFNFNFVVQAIGLPFSQALSTSAAERPGWIAIVLCFAGLVLLFLNRSSPVIQQAVPSLIVLAYGLINIWAISMFRNAGGVVSWYTTHSMPIWIGLVGLASVLWVNRHVASPHLRLLRLLPLPAAWSIMVGLALVLLYLNADITYTDKVFFLKYRTSATASCLRNYRIAPTSCEGYVYSWGVGRPMSLGALAAPLERRHLSVFAPDEQWALQGDFVLDNVRVQEVPGVAQVFWSLDQGASAVAFSDYRPLNLVVHTPTSVTWSVILPKGLTHATFHSAVTVSTVATNDSTASGINFEVYLKHGGHRPALAFHRSLRLGDHAWHSFDIPLDSFAGQAVTLRLTSSALGTSTQDWAVYQHPTIDVSLNSHTAVAPEAGTHPYVPGLTSRGVSLPTADTAHMQPLNQCIGNFTHVYVRAITAPTLQPVVLEFAYDAVVGNTPIPSSPIEIPLYADGHEHTYSYDLKLLELPPSLRLTRVGLYHISGPPWARTLTPGLVKIQEARLIRGPGSCSV